MKILFLALVSTLTAAACSSTSTPTPAPAAEEALEPCICCGTDVGMLTREACSGGRCDGVKRAPPATGLCNEVPDDAATDAAADAADAGHD